MKTECDARLLATVLARDGDTGEKEHMKSTVESLRRHVLEYHSFYIFAHLLLTPCLPQALFLLAPGDVDVGFPLVGVFLGGLLILLAQTIKHKLPKLKGLARASLAIGLLVDAVLLVRLSKPASSSPAVALALLTLSAISIWWTAIFFLDLSDRDKEKHKLVLLKFIGPVALCAFVMWGSIMAFLKYETHRVLAASGATFEMLPRELMRLALGYLVVISFSLILLLFFYRRALRGVSDEDRV